MKHLNFLSLFIFGTLMGHQVNPQVVSGNAKFTQDAKGLAIETFTEKSHINWERFSIPHGDKVQFIQPNSLSTVLNRVTHDPTEILGSLESNGNVFFLNPNGILIGKDAKVRVGGFLATTQELVNQEAFLLNEPLHFAGGERSIVNLGSIEALHGDIYLLSTTIENAGSMHAPNGTATLGAADKIVICPHNAKKFAVEMNASEIGKIENSGEIIAQAVTLHAKGNPYSVAIRHSGLIDATSISTEGGQILLQAENGKVLAEKSSKIIANNSFAEAKILGVEVSIGEEAIIDLSANNGGGSIFIGGGTKGNDPSIQNAKKTTVASGASLIADGLTEGSGGKIIVWSDEQTTFSGTASTTGGNLSGDGGFIEISGKNGWKYEGSVDTKAENGKAGIFLIDPSNIQISNTPSAGGSFDDGTPNTYAATLPTALLALDDLYAALDNANVIIDTSSADSSLGNIEFMSNFKYSALSASTGSLTLNADYAIMISSNFIYIGVTEGGNTITFNAPYAVHTLAPVTIINSAINATTGIFNVQADFNLFNSRDLTINATDMICFIEGGKTNMIFSESFGVNFQGNNQIIIDGKVTCDNADFVNMTSPSMSIQNMELINSNTMNLQ